MNEAQVLGEYMEGIWTLTKKEDQDPEVLHAAYSGVYRIAVDLAAGAVVCGYGKKRDLAKRRSGIIGIAERDRKMNKTEALKKALERIGIKTETDLNEAIRRLPALDLYIMACPRQQAERQTA